MIRIKDYILNEDDISYIVGNTDDDTELKIQWKDNTSTYIKASFDDIEWNYGSPQETQRQIQKELCKSCYYRDTISNKLKELEEKNKKLKEEYITLEKDYGTCELESSKLRDKIKELEEENKTLKELNVCVGCDNNPDYKSRIDKAIEYIDKLEIDEDGNSQYGSYSIFEEDYSNKNISIDEMLFKMKDILKGEEND
jgi:chromosome segregation ATPase